MESKVVTFPFRHKGLVEKRTKKNYLYMEKEC